MLAAGHSRHALDRRLANGTLVRLLPRVYRFAGTVETWHQKVMAACLWGSPDAIASHRSAGRLWGLEGFLQEGIEITVPRATRSRSKLLTVHRTLELIRWDVARRERIPVTGVNRTLIDLGAVLDPEELEAALDSALRQRLTTVRWLHWELTQHTVASRGPIKLSGRGKAGLAGLRAGVEARR
ncbi:MAG: hypothetical protein ABR575_09665, partial [Actinomycetota bacterium]